MKAQRALAAKRAGGSSLSQARAGRSGSAAPRLLASPARTGSGASYAGFVSGRFEWMKQALDALPWSARGALVLAFLGAAALGAWRFRGHLPF